MCHRFVTWAPTNLLIVSSVKCIAAWHSETTHSLRTVFAAGCSSMFSFDWRPIWRLAHLWQCMLHKRTKCRWPLEQLQVLVHLVMCHGTSAGLHLGSILHTDHTGRRGARLSSAHEFYLRAIKAERKLWVTVFLLSSCHLKSPLSSPSLSMCGVPLSPFRQVTIVFGNLIFLSCSFSVFFSFFFFLVFVCVCTRSRLSHHFVQTCNHLNTVFWPFFISNF